MMMKTGACTLDLAVAGEIISTFYASKYSYEKTKKQSKFIGNLL